MNPTSCEQPSSTEMRATARRVGFFALLAFFALTNADYGLRITYHPPQTTSSPGEARFWLAHAFVFIPALLLIGYDISTWLGPLLLSLWRRLGSLSRWKQFLGLCLLALGTFALAEFGREIFLLDRFITDDEYAVRFGGQIMALGHFAIPAPEPFDAYPKLFTRLKDGMWTSFDYPGLFAVWAFALKTNLDSMVFAFFAVVSVVCVTLTTGRLLGTQWATLAAVFFLFSPMVALLSMTTHAHLVSRGLLALTLLIYVVANDRQSVFWWAVTGFVFGLSCLIRTPENFILMGPLLVYQVVGIFVGRHQGWKVWVGLFMGGIGPLLFLMWHSWHVTGDPLLPARFAPGIVNFEPQSGTLWERFGYNTSYNVLMLSVWFMGPVGMLLALYGSMTNRFTKLLSLGIVLLLMLGLIHDDSGIHIVGPIHYSETAVFLAILAVFGVAQLTKHVSLTPRAKEIFASCLALTILIGFGTFTFWNAMALRDHNNIQEQIYNFVESPELGKAVVLAPRFRLAWCAVPEFRLTGSWVFEWRPPTPDFSERVLILHDFPELQSQLEAKFPARTFYRLETLESDPYLRLVPVSDESKETLDFEGWTVPYGELPESLKEINSEPNRPKRVTQ